MSFTLRPALLCAASVSAAALTSYFLFYRLRRLQEQQPATGDAATVSDPGMEDQEQDICPIFCVPIPEEFPLQLPVGLSSSCGPLMGIWQYCTEVDPTKKVFASSYTKWLSNQIKMVEVRLQHKAIYNGLLSEHWWVLINEFYNVLSPELPPQYFARATVVACIKRIGSSISEANIHLRTEFSDSSVQDVLLKTKVAIGFKGVSVDADGRFRFHHSDASQTLESPAFLTPSKPRRPPPGF